MKQIIPLTLLWIAILTLGAACQNTPPDEPSESAATTQDLNSIRSGFTQAYTSADAQRLADFWSEDGILIPPRGLAIKGRENILASYRSLFATYEVGAFSLSPEETRISGDWAFEWGTLSVELGALEPTASLEAPETKQETRSKTEAAPAEEEVAVLDTNYYMVVLNRVDQQWKIRWLMTTNPPEYAAEVEAKGD